MVSPYFVNRNLNRAEQAQRKQIIPTYGKLKASRIPAKIVTCRLYDSKKISYDYVNCTGFSLVALKFTLMHESLCNWVNIISWQIPNVLVAQFDLTCIGIDV